MDAAALTALPVRVSARPVDLPVRSSDEVIRLARALPDAVVLAGAWDAGEIVLATDPVVRELEAPEPFAVLDQQPVVLGRAPAGAVGGGWFGWLAFPDPAAPHRPAHALGFYPHVLRLRGGQWWDEALVGILDDADLEHRRRQLCEVLAGEAAPPALYQLGTVTPSRTRAEHVAAVERCIHHIRAGEICQANICLTLRARFDGSPADLAADLIAALQPAYGGYLALGERSVITGSPELFVRRAGRHVISRPIKGTRPRTGDAAADEARRLAGSQKDRAENVMIVDLVRNDLSRVAATGTVRASQLLDVVPAPGVWHLVSTVEARLRDAVTDADLLRAAFPPGSVTGTPKARAAGVIAELEESPRGVYTGAIGYASPVAGAEFNVAIRTVEIAGEALTLGVGGGITVDSTPVQEWWECFDKAWPLLRAAGGALPDVGARRPPPDPRGAGGVFDTSLCRGGVVLEAAEHVARLERSVYELYQRPLPDRAVHALTWPQHGAGWQRQRIDITPDGDVHVVTRAAAAPTPVSRQPGLEAVVVQQPAGLGPHKWADRTCQEALEASHPACVVLLADGAALLEGTRANVVAVCGDRLVTAPLDGRILPGVSRTVLLELARDMGVPLELRWPDLRYADALAVVGSVSGLQWIRRCGAWSAEEPGPLLSGLSRRLIERWTGGATVRR